MTRSSRVSIGRFVFVLAALLLQSAFSFQVGRSSSGPPTMSPAFSTRNHNTRTTPARQQSLPVLSIRGGSIQTNPLSMVMVDALAVINNFYQSSPYIAAALTCGTKASAADYVAQRSSKNFEKARNIAFLVYGAIYQGMAQEYIYNHLYPIWFGTGTSVGIVLQKVAFDLLIQTTLVTLPIAYLTKAAIFRQTPLEALRRYCEDVTTHGLLVKYFLLWGPVQCITFSIIPEHLRVSFIAVVSFFWLIILSSVSARPRKISNVKTPVHSGTDKQVPMEEEALATDSSTVEN